MIGFQVMPQATRCSISILEPSAHALSFPLHALMRERFIVFPEFSKPISYHCIPTPDSRRHLCLPEIWRDDIAASECCLVTLPKRFCLPSERLWCWVLQQFFSFGLPPFVQEF